MDQFQEHLSIRDRLLDSVVNKIKESFNCENPDHFPPLDKRQTDIEGYMSKHIVYELASLIVKVMISIDGEVCQLLEGIETKMFQALMITAELVRVSIKTKMEHPKDKQLDIPINEDLATTLLTYYNTFNDLEWRIDQISCGQTFIDPIKISREERHTTFGDLIKTVSDKVGNTVEFRRTREDKVNGSIRDTPEGKIFFSPSLDLISHHSLASFATGRLGFKEIANLKFFNDLVQKIHGTNEYTNFDDRMKYTMDNYMVAITCFLSPDPEFLRAFMFCRANDDDLEESEVEEMLLCEVQKPVINSMDEFLIDDHKCELGNFLNIRDIISYDDFDTFDLGIVPCASIRKNFNKDGDSIFYLHNRFEIIADRAGTSFTVKSCEVNFDREIGPLGKECGLSFN